MDKHLLDYDGLNYYNDKLKNYITSVVNSGVDADTVDGVHLDLKSSSLECDLIASWSKDGTTIEAMPWTSVKTMLGLGSNAYSNTSYLPITAGESNPLTGCLHIKSTTGGSYNEALRLYPYNGTTSILLAGTDVGNSGTSANSWCLITTRGNFYLNKAGSTYHTGQELCNVSNNWGIGTATPSEKLEVGGNVKSTQFKGPLGQDDSVKIYVESNNEINFGGSATSDTIFIGCNAKDSKAIPSKFVFGGSSGTAAVTAGSFNTGSSVIKYNSTTGCLEITA